MKEHKLIFSSWFERLGLAVKYFDVGARGDVAEPWSLFSRQGIKVIGFEPDPGECARLSVEHPERKYYPNALWCEPARRPFYLCGWASTSSMYPPAEKSNTQYRPEHWTGRVPTQTLQVDCVTLDSIVIPEDAPDFIKIDTQGAELEILKGAEQLLMRGSPLVLAETWCAEVYAGMPLTHDVMAFMHGLGYQVFDLNVAAAWQHRNSRLNDVHCKAKTIGFDLLFVKRLDKLRFQHVEELLRFAGLCELFGFRDYALAALEGSEFRSDLVSQAIDELIKNDRWERSIGRRLGMIVDRIFRRTSRLWPQLH